MSYYEILGVDKTASQDEIKKAFKALVKTKHPDKHAGDKEAEAEFKKINEAFATLSDVEKRRIYDGGRPSAAFTFESMFEQIFNQKPLVKGKDIHVSLGITLEDVMQGVEREVEFPQSELCKDCGGEGGKFGLCRGCHGSRAKTLRGQGMDVRITCNECRGQGVVLTQACPSCKGGLTSSQQQTIKVKIPAGIQNGSNLAFRGAGNPVKDGINGDLIVGIFVEPHDLFERFDNDLKVKVFVPFTQLINGSEIQVPTPQGLQNLTIDKGTTSGAIFELKGLGLAHAMGRYKGSLFVEVVADIPQELSEKYQSLLNELAELEELQPSQARVKYLNSVETYNGRSQK